MSFQNVLEAKTCIARSKFAGFLHENSTIYVYSLNLKLFANALDVTPTMHRFLAGGMQMLDTGEMHFFVGRSGFAHSLKSAVS